MAAVYHLVDGPVVAEVDNLGSLSLEQPADDVDGGVVPVEQAGCGDEAHRVGRHVEGRPTVDSASHADIYADIYADSHRKYNSRISE